MLCPNCGTEVGDKATLCERCAANARASGGGASIGAIRPALKVVRLKPGEPTPPEFLRHQQMQQQQHGSQAQHSGPTVEDPSFSGSFASHPHMEQIAPEVPHYASRGSRSRTSVIGVLLIVFAAYGLVWFLRGPGSKLLESVQPEPENPAQSFSHIVIHEKKDVVVDGVRIVGKLSIEGDDFALTAVRASYSTSKNLLQLSYTGEVPETYTGPAHDPKQELVRVSMQFKPLGNKLDRDKLQSYMVELLGAAGPLRFVKTYSAHLAAFGEVSPLAGALKQGEVVRGALQDNRMTERDGQNLRIFWDLRFQTPLVVEP